MLSLYRYALALGLFSVLLLNGPGTLEVQAGPAKGPNRAPNKGANTGQNPFVQQVEALHQVRVLLARADHDYKGHRVKAMQHIRAAMHTLQPNHRHPHPPLPKGGNEPQAVSDAQLRQAIQQLNVIGAQLNGVSRPGATKAVSLIRSAINELNIALSIR